LGKWSRVKVEWLCAKEPPVIGPAGPGAAGRPAAPLETAPSRPPNTSVDGLARRTVHAFFWGGLQQNLLPPAPKGKFDTPAGCKSMRQVKLPMNYGYSLITVFTAGIWSPMRVAWRCFEGPNGASLVPGSALPGAVPSFSYRGESHVFR
jgi:hypothetical protein